MNIWGRCQEYEVGGIWPQFWSLTLVSVALENMLDCGQEYVLWNAVFRCCSLRGTVVDVETLSLKYIRVANVTSKLHDVIGHMTTLNLISYRPTCFVGIGTSLTFIW